jgi:murein DD-endopeptidase MepM/ murein hydrolase activator NlpD
MEILDFLYRIGSRGAETGWRAGAVLCGTALLWGCAGSQRPVAVQPVSVPAEPVAHEPSAARDPSGPAVGEGVIHVVQPGQTLWRIARVYGVTPGQLARVNELGDPTRLDVGLRLLIPGVSSVREVPPYPAPLPDLPSEPSVATEFKAAVATQWEWPLPEGRILSYFGVPRGSHDHGGIDIRGARGEEVRASRPGRVVYSGAGMRGYGKVVIVDHGDGFRSLYAHNSKLLVRVNDRVRRGQSVALVGSTGNASGNHCHFEIRRNDKPVDPLLYLLPPFEAR